MNDIRQKVEALTGQPSQHNKIPITKEQVTVDQILLENATILSEIVQSNRKRKNKNFINASTMGLVYQFEQNLIRLGGRLSVSTMASKNEEGNFLDTLKRIQMRKKVVKKD